MGSLPAGRGLPRKTSNLACEIAPECVGGVSTGAVSTWQLVPITQTASSVPAPAPSPPSSGAGVSLEVGPAGLGMVDDGAMSCGALGLFRVKWPRAFCNTPSPVGYWAT